MSLWSAAWAARMVVIFVVALLLMILTKPAAPLAIVVFCSPLLIALVALPRYVRTRVELHEDRVVAVNPGGAPDEMRAAEMARIDQSKVRAGSFVVVDVNYPTAEFVGTDGRRLRAQALPGATIRAGKRNRRAVIDWAARHGIPCALEEEPHLPSLDHPWDRDDGGRGP